MAAFVKFEVPSDLMEKQLAFLEKAKKKGKIKIGINEVTKAVERGNAKLVFMALDVTPQEILMHVPVICAEKNIPFSYISTKKELGEKSGIAVGTSAIAVLEEGDAKSELQDIVNKLKEISK